MWQSHRLQKTQLRRLLSPACFGSEISTTKRYHLNREKGREKEKVYIYSDSASERTKTLCHKTLILIHFPLNDKLVTPSVCPFTPSVRCFLCLSGRNRSPCPCYETCKKCQALQFVFIAVLVNIRTTGKGFHVTWK